MIRGVIKSADAMIRTLSHHAWSILERAELPESIMSLSEGVRAFSML
jgi:hypothetical protein